MCAMTPTCVPWLLHKCGTTCVYAWHNAHFSFCSRTHIWRMSEWSCHYDTHMCAMTHICVPWLTYVCHTYDAWVSDHAIMTHIWTFCIMTHIWTSRTTLMKEGVMARMNESWHTWMSHGTHESVTHILHYDTYMNKSENTHEEMSHGTHEWVMAHMNESWHTWMSDTHYILWHTYERVVPHLWRKESWHTWMSHVSWLIHVWCMMSYDSFIYNEYIILYVCNMTHLHVWHDPSTR